jgi:hypothetical protein
MDFFTLNYTKMAIDSQLVSGFNMVTKIDMCFLTRTSYTLCLRDTKRAEEFIKCSLVVD